MSVYKKINLLVFTLFLMILLGCIGYWELICNLENCGYAFRNDILRPVIQGSISLSIISGFFLFLPPRYFELWLKWIFSWAFPLSIILVATIEDNGHILSFPRALVAQLFGIFLGILSATFILFRLFLISKKSGKTAKVQTIE